MLQHQYQMSCLITGEKASARWHNEITATAARVNDYCLAQTWQLFIAMISPSGVRERVDCMCVVHSTLQGFALI